MLQIVSGLYLNASNPISAMFVVVYLALFAPLGASGPENYRCISQKERSYIMNERTKQVQDNVGSDYERLK